MEFSQQRKSHTSIGKWQLANDYFSHHYSSSRFYETGIDEFGFLKNIFTCCMEMDCGERFVCHEPSRRDLDHPKSSPLPIPATPSMAPSKINQVTTNTAKAVVVGYILFKVLRAVATWECGGCGAWAF